MRSITNLPSITRRRENNKVLKNGKILRTRYNKNNNGITTLQKLSNISAVTLLPQICNAVTTML